MKSKKLFLDGYNCSQSVFLPFAVKHNIDMKSASKIMSPFGGGISNTDNICGAVSGGIAALGLEFGHADADDRENKMKCKKITQRFVIDFEKKHGSLYCTKLAGFDLSRSCEREEAGNQEVFEKICTKLVDSAEKMVKTLIHENKS